jgi:hypothetical protein
MGYSVNLRLEAKLRHIAQVLKQPLSWVVNELIDLGMDAFEKKHLKKEENQSIKSDIEKVA